MLRPIEFSTTMLANCDVVDAITQFETEIRAARQLDDIRSAKARGVSLGRKKDLTEQEASAEGAY